MALHLSEVLRHFGDAYLREHQLSTAQAKAWRAILNCRTEALGGQLLQCDSCGATQWHWHSCRNRHCPRCQARQRDAWRQARIAELLDVPYCHLVFTLPHELNALAATHARWVYDTVMRCTAATLTEFAANPRWLGGTGAFTLVLHTWTQELHRHVHVHALMACGALVQGEGAADRWVTPVRSERFLFPVNALSEVFRGKFLQELQHASAHGALPRDPAADAWARARRVRLLWAKNWVVYAKTPLAGPAAVLDYLARYTNRTAIGEERLQGMDAQQVRIRARVNGAKGKQRRSRSVAIEGIDFIGRFLQHVLPAGFKRIRHFGLLSPSVKAKRLAVARVLLQMPAANPVALEDARDFMQRVARFDIQRCRCCGAGSLRLLCEVQPVWLARYASCACRSPP